MTLIKICKVEDISTARICGDLKVDFIGLHAINGLSQDRSKLFKRINEELRNYYPNTNSVLVTKVIDVDTIAEMLAVTRVEYVQIHRPTNSKELSRLEVLCAKTLGKKPKIIPVIAASDTNAITMIHQLLQNKSQIKFFLLDTDWRGGTGNTASLKRLKHLMNEIRGVQTLIGGGLNDKNVSGLVDELNPIGVDVQSGLRFSSRKNSGIKDPILIKNFVSTIKKASPSPCYLGQNRPLVSVALTNITLAETQSSLKKFSKTDVDLIHLDYSNGSQAPLFNVNPLHVAVALRQAAPCLPYDLHLFTLHYHHWKQVITNYKLENPLLRTVYLHIESPNDVSAKLINKFEVVTESEEIGFGLALHSTKFDVESMRKVLKLLSDTRVCDLSIVTHSARHSIIKVKKHDRTLLNTISLWLKEKSQICHLSVDRDMNIKKLEILAEERPSHVIVGKFLVENDNPQKQITFMRNLLQNPLKIDSLSFDPY